MHRACGREAHSPPVLLPSSKIPVPEAAAAADVATGSSVSVLDGLPFGSLFEAVLFGPAVFWSLPVAVGVGVVVPSVVARGNNPRSRRLCSCTCPKTESMEVQSSNATKAQTSGRLKCIIKYAVVGLLLVDSTHKPARQKPQTRRWA
jgi:hypothetical protein